jgi:hypothetical protein
MRGDFFLGCLFEGARQCREKGGGPWKDDDIKA